jgi:putative FmdB family regulatory protein
VDEGGIGGASLAVAGVECQPGPVDEECPAVPTYQYACTNAAGKHEFEVVQSFTDAPVAECPDCGSAVRKVYGSVGVVFKGSGFYRTDSRAGSSASESAGGSAKKEPAAATTSASSGSSSGSSTSSAGTSSSAPKAAAS